MKVLLWRLTGATLYGITLRQFLPREEAVKRLTVADTPARHSRGTGWVALPPTLGLHLPQPGAVGAPRAYTVPEGLVLGQPCFWKGLAPQQRAQDRHGGSVCFSVQGSADSKQLKTPHETFLFST